MTRDIQADAELIRNSIPFDIATIELHEGGEDFWVYEINSEWMFRFPRNERSQMAFEKELRFLSIFNSITPLPTPNYQYFGEGFAGYPKIKGLSLSIERFDAFSKSAQENLARQIGSFLSVLHNFPIEDAIKIGITQGWNGVHHQNGLYFLEKVSRLLSSSARKNSIRCMESLLAEGFISKLIHGDFYFPDHVFYNESKQQLGVIDFADMTIYDPAHDFQCIVETGGDAFFESVLKYYRTEQDAALLKRSKIRLAARPLFVAVYLFANGNGEQLASQVTHIERLFA